MNYNVCPKCHGSGVLRPYKNTKLMTPCLNCDSTGRIILNIERGIMLDKIYGIDYNPYACGGIGNCKLVRGLRKTVLFYDESEMLKELAKLKKDYTVGELSVFISSINREEYKI